MNRLASAVLVLGFIAVLAAMAARVGIDLSLGPDDDALAHEAVAAVPAGSRVIIAQHRDRARPFAAERELAYDVVTFVPVASQTEVVAEYRRVAQATGWAERISAPGNRGPQPDPARTIRMCRANMELDIDATGDVVSRGLRGKPPDTGFCRPTPMLPFSQTTLAAIGLTVPFLFYLSSAQVQRVRARRTRGATSLSAGGLAAYAPAFAWVPYLVIAVRPPPELGLPSILRDAGIVVSLAGIVIAFWALSTLGRHFDLDLEVHADHELIRSGPYALSRHPIYSGLILHTAGAFLATGGVLFGLGSALITVPILVMRARAEEKLLREQFGAEYDAYAKKVGMLVPFL